MEPVDSISQMERTKEQEEPGIENGKAGFDFWRKTLNSAKLIAAPMVDQSELAWRILSRRHGAQLCYSPMYHASVFVRDAKYRREALASCAEDHPLIIQFCANDPETLLKAAQYAEDHCEAIDLNLGCPQAIAKRGHYGAFLQEEWDLVYNMVRLCTQTLKVPFTCKIRIFESVEKTVKYAKMLESAGCMLLTVHGRTREQKGISTGLASWKHIKAVRESVKIPVFANGNIQYLTDVNECIEQTGVQGVMSAEGNLHNPALFEGKQPVVWDMAKEYLDLAKKYPCPISYIRGHLFKLCHHALLVHTDVRDALSLSKEMIDFESVVTNLEKACQPHLEEFETNADKFVTNLPFPYWICQPYVRPTPDKRSERAREKVFKRSIESPNSLDASTLSANKLKKLRRNPRKSFTSREEQYEKCPCGNPRGLKCSFCLCKTCCKAKAKVEILDCPGHHMLFKTRRQRLMMCAERQENKKPQLSDNLCEMKYQRTDPNCEKSCDNQIEQLNLVKSEPDPS